MKKKKMVIIAALIVVAAGGVYYWKKKQGAATAQVQYVTAMAEKGAITSSISATGNVYVDQLATVDPTITGTVSGLAVKVGDKVEKGQLLFTIVNDDLTLNVAQAQASYQQALNSLKSAKVNKDQAQADYDAAKKKDKADNTAYTSEQLQVLKDKIDIARNSVDQAQTTVDNSLLSLQNQQADAAKRRVTAPISGTVNEVNIKNGDDLSRTSSNSSSSAPIIIGDLGTLKASVTVNEVDISKVADGQKVMLSLDALDSTTVTGKVEKIDSLGTVSQGVVSYNVIIDFDQLDERIKPQMSVSVSIITDVKQNVLVVPSGAVKTENGASYVEVLNSGSTPERKNVQVGISNGTETEITSGISEGDKVVTQTIDPTATATQSTNVNGGIRIPGVSTGGGGARFGD